MSSFFKLLLADGTLLNYKCVQLGVTALVLTFRSIRTFRLGWFSNFRLGAINFSFTFSCYSCMSNYLSIIKGNATFKRVFAFNGDYMYKWNCLYGLCLLDFDLNSNK